MVLTIRLQYGTCWIIQKSQKCIFEWSKVPKRRIWANIWSLVSWIDLIMHTVIVQDRSNNLATIWHMLYHSKVTKMHFWMTQNAQKEDLCQYLEFCCLDRLDNAYCDITQCFYCLVLLPVHEGSFKHYKNAFLNDSKSQKWSFWPFYRLRLFQYGWYLILWYIKRILKYWLSSRWWKWDSNMHLSKIKKSKWATNKV